jgi:hypothetical protein
MFVRIVLDTCTVRNHTDSCFPQLDLNLIQRKSDLVRLSLSASAFVELTAQIADGRLPFARWQEGIKPINAILDQRWPCLPNGKQLAWLAGTQIVEPIENVEDESRYMRACWHHLLDVTPEEIGKCQVVYRVSGGTLRSIRLDAQTLKDMIAGQRQEWINYIRRMQTDLLSREITAADEDAIRKVMRSDFGNDLLDAPCVAEKLDAACRMIARFVARALPSEMAAYNPESEKHRGDSFDLNLLFYVPLPAVIVTGDGRFVRGLRETGAPHGGQVLSIDEFNTHLGNGTLAALVSDFQTPGRQHRQQSEAAYFRWGNRGYNPNDDWSDGSVRIYAHMRDV